MALLGMKLTAKQQRIWDMKRPIADGGEEKTRDQIASELGISIPVVSKTITVIRKKLGLQADKRDNTNPEAFTPGMIETAVDAVNDVMKRVGFPERIREGMVRRLKVKHNSAVTELKPITDEQMKSQYREKIGLAFSYMDDKAMSEASFRDLSVGVTAMTEKLQLLEGKPTQIISDLERKQLVELMPLFLLEAQRRGVVIPGVVTEKVVGP